jgi:hypothetical protein
MCDPYPDETKWLQITPKQSPLHHLKYGLMTEKILHLVKEKRQKIRNDYIKKSINNLPNDQLRKMMKKIKKDRPKTNINWGWSKKIRTNWYINENIPTYYLKNQLNLYNKGPPEYNLLDRVICLKTCNAYIIFKNKKYTSNRWVYGLKIDVPFPYMFKDNDKNIINDPKLVDWNRFYIDLYMVKHNKLDVVKLDPWTLKYIGTDTKKEYYDKIKKCKQEYKNYKKRLDLWIKQIQPAFRKTNLRINCYDKWFNIKIDVFSLKNPPLLIHTTNKEIIDNWNKQWDIIINIIEKERQNVAKKAIQAAIDQKNKFHNLKRKRLAENAIQAAIDQKNKFHSLKKQKVEKNKSVVNKCKLIT